MAINDLFQAISDTLTIWSVKRNRRNSIWPSRPASGKKSPKKMVSFFVRGLSFRPSFSPSPSSVGYQSFESEEDEEIGVWQKKILMGGKCQPLDFSGIIYYDCAGRQVSECPMTPFRSPITPFAPCRDSAATSPSVSV